MNGNEEGQQKVQGWELGGRAPGGRGSPREAQAPRLLALNVTVDPFSFCLGLA